MGLPYRTVVQAGQGRIHAILLTLHLSSQRVGSLNSGEHGVLGGGGPLLTTGSLSCVKFCASMERPDFDDPRNL